MCEIFAKSYRKQKCCEKHITSHQGRQRSDDDGKRLNKMVLVRSDGRKEFIRGFFPKELEGKTVRDLRKDDYDFMWDKFGMKETKVDVAVKRYRNKDHKVG